MAIIIIFFSWILVLLNILSILVMIFLERKDTRSIQSWILMFMLLPPGFSLYLYFVLGRGPKLNRSKVEKRNCRIVDEVNNCLDIKKYRTLPLDEGIDTSILKFNFMHNNSAITQNNDLKIFNTAKEKFEELLKDIRGAKSTIHLIYYIIKNDIIGNEIIDALTEKAKEGVKIRLIYDDVGCIAVSKKMFKKLKEAGGEVFSFFPSYLKFINLNLNYRNHRKIVVIDGKIGYVGGMNIGDEYMSLHKRLNPWKDCHLKIVGEAVYFLQLRFLQDLSYVSNHSVETEENFKEKYFPPTYINKTTYTQIVDSGPNKKDYENIKSSYLRMLYSAKKEIFIQTPYLGLDESFLYALISTANYGVKINVMLPKIYDKRIVYRLTSSYINQLLSAGINVYLYNGFIHSKTMVMDDDVTSIGTANFDIRSFSLNFEVNAFITDKDITNKMKEIFYNDMKNCVKLDESYEKNKSLLIKIEEGLSRLFAPLF